LLILLAMTGARPAAAENKTARIMRAEFVQAIVFC
jgi:hypothetical protein